MVKKSKHILYGIQGTGNGHIVESTPLINSLKARKHQVDVIISGYRSDITDQFDHFQPYRVLPGLSFGIDSGKISIAKTLQTCFIRQTILDINTLDLSAYDLIITDYEPITAWAAKKNKKNILGIGHQYAFKHNIPKAYSTQISETLMAYFAPANNAFGLHWHHFDSSILPPILRPTIHQAGLKKSQKNGKILVYMVSHDITDICKFLNYFKNFEFIIYSNDTPSIQYDNHITIKGISFNGFMQDLITCEKVMSTAGFCTASEAIHLGKDLLVIPIKGQMEQESNALALETLDKGMVMHKYCKKTMKKWLNRPAPEHIPFCNVVDKLIDWIEADDINETENLIHSCWQTIQVATTD